MNNLYESFKSLSQEQLNLALIESCENGELDKVKYLLTSPELSINANIHANQDEALIQACGRKRSDVVKYLLASPDLKEHADIHAKADGAFYRAMNTGNWELIEFFIFEMNIEHDTSIKCYLNIFSKKEEQKVEQMFKVRDLHKELNEKKSPNNNKKVKI